MSLGHVDLEAILVFTIELSISGHIIGYSEFSFVTKLSPVLRAVQTLMYSEHLILHALCPISTVSIQCSVEQAECSELFFL